MLSTRGDQAHLPKASKFALIFDSKILFKILTYITRNLIVIVEI